MFTTQTISIAGMRLVVMEQAEFERLCNLAGQRVHDDTLPPLPEPDQRGLVPALEFTRISIARDIIRERKSLGLSQTELADLAGLRQETISRLESGKHTAAPRTIDRIDAALKQARKQRKKGK
ncbi:MAG: helix-turn-helix domain-containing protein [Planctomycetota bacterium]|nr:helix-turn-helix domain-containing protein [Planctomycetota bacterium]